MDEKKGKIYFLNKLKTLIVKKEPKDIPDYHKFVCDEAHSDYCIYCGQTWFDHKKAKFQ